MTSTPNSSEETKKDNQYIRIALNSEQREQLKQLPPSWEDLLRYEGGGSKPEGKRLFNAVKFVFLFLRRLFKLGITLPRVDDFERFFDGMQITFEKDNLNRLSSENENFKLGAKLVELSVKLGLPQPTSSNIDDWLSNLLSSDNVDLTEDLQNPTEIGNAVIHAIKTSSIDIHVINTNNIPLVFYKLAAGYYQYKQLVKFLSDKGIPEPTPESMEEWGEKYLFMNQCHDLLEFLFNMKELLPEDEVSMNSNKFHVLSRQMLKAFYLMHDRSEDNECDSEDNVECNCY